MGKRVGQHAESAQGWIDGVEIFDLGVELAVGGGVEFERSRTLEQDLDEQGEEIQVFFGRG